MKRQKGFTLLEVLVAIVVLAVGLVGLVGLQTVSIKNNQTAYYRAIAIQQVYDMADRMRANLAGVKEGDYNAIDATTPTDPSCISAGCTIPNVAVTDHFQWNKNNGIFLPGGTGTVTCPATATCPSATQPVTEGTVFNITVNWKERDGTTTGATHSITESIRP
jgi:type IV pilus assembly protein PilV